MLIQKLKYYLKTSAAQRAHDRLDYQAVLNHYDDALADLKEAYDAMTAVVDDKETADNTWACIVEYTYQSPMAGAIMGLRSAPLTAHEDCCFLNKDGCCIFSGCKNYGKNMRYFYQKKILDFWRKKRDTFWTQKYANVK